MKRVLQSIFLAAISIFGYGCEITPEIISPKPKLPVAQSGTQQISPQAVIPTEDSFGYGWILWYIPILIIALGWAYREFIKPRRTTLKKVRRRTR